MSLGDYNDFLPFKMIENQVVLVFECTLYSILYKCNDRNKLLKQLSEMKDQIVKNGYVKYRFQCHQQ